MPAHRILLAQWLLVAFIVVLVVGTLVFVCVICRYRYKWLKEKREMDKLPRRQAALKKTVVPPLDLMGKNNRWGVFGN